LLVVAVTNAVPVRAADDDTAGGAQEAVLAANVGAVPSFFLGAHGGHA